MKIDVVKDYDWTSAPRGSGFRKKAPRVWVKSYKIDSNLVLKRFKSYAQIGTVTDPDKFYDELYGDATEPEDDFNFPFFQDNVRSFGNVFGDTFQNGFGGGGGIGESFDNTIQTGLGLVAQLNGANIIQGGKSGFNSSGGTLLDKSIAAASGAVKGATANNPGSYMETPKFYEYTSAEEGPLMVSFVLANTINDDYDKNYQLVKKLTEINRPKRINSITMEPPRIYQVKVPGHRFIRWAYCSDFSIDLLGTKRNIDGIIVPEGYMINMAFQSLTVEVSNFMDKV